MPIGLGDLKNPTVSKQSAHRWQLGRQSYALAALYSQKDLLIKISIGGRRMLFLGSRARPVRRADNFTVIHEAIV
jgi:hypothetical protein